MEYRVGFEIFDIIVLNINTSMYECLYCTKKFNLTLGSTGKYCSLSCSSKSRSEIKHKKTLEKYLSNPKLCKHCNNAIEYRLRKSNIFCSRSCAGLYNNSKKDWSKIKTGPKPKTIPKPKKKVVKDKLDFSYPFTRIYLCTCKITGKKWFSPTVKTIHPSSANTKKMYSYQCRFTFSISEYPELFKNASDLIKKHGWYAASNRGNNLKGCSRDHLYSISDGFKNNVDPKIMSHPMNCQIIPHQANQSKNKKSLITLEELLERIKKFENMESVTGIQPV